MEEAHVGQGLQKKRMKQVSYRKHEEQEQRRRGEVAAPDAARALVPAARWRVAAPAAPAARVVHQQLPPRVSSRCQSAGGQPRADTARSHRMDVYTLCLAVASCSPNYKLHIHDLLSLALSPPWVSPLRVRRVSQLVRATLYFAPTM